jgi:hypothetical protein
MFLMRSVAPQTRHALPRAGHPRLGFCTRGFHGRNKPGDDDAETSFQGPLAPHAPALRSPGGDSLRRVSPPESFRFFPADVFLLDVAGKSQRSGGGCA